MLEENKFSGYLIYAIGEIILVVIGILIALQINNWNEGRKLNKHKKDLIANLLTDFKATKSTLASAIEEKSYQLNEMNDFMKIVYDDSQTMSVDSMRRKAVTFFGESNMKPSISSYNEAVSNGDYKLLKNKELKQSIDAFFKHADTYARIYDLSAENFFNGSVYELRESLGSLKSIVVGNNSFTAMPYKKLSYDEYIAKIKEPITTAVFENGHSIKRNLIGVLGQMQSSCDSIVLILSELEKES